MYSVQIAVSDGTLSRIALSIEYFEQDDITLYRNLSTTPLVLGTDWQWDGATHINLLTDSPVPAGGYITVRRNTNIDRAFNIYDGGAAFTRDTLDENFKQMIYLAQEFTEGNGLTGLFFPLNMRGFKITDLGAGEDSGDAVNRGQLDAVDTKVAALENTFVSGTNSYPWYTVTTSDTDTVTPPYLFSKAALYLDGICQTPEYSYVVVDNTIMLADPVPTGTHVFVRVGEDVGLNTEYATTDQLANAVLDTADEHNSMRAEWELADAVIQGQVDSRAMVGANSDITALTGLSGGITGLTTGVAASSGIVGEVASAASSSAVTLTSGSSANVVSLSLPAGDWELESAFQIINSGNVTVLAFGVSTAAGVLPATWYDVYSITTTIGSGTSNRQGMARRILLNTTATVYLVAQATFTGTATANGYVRARRVR